MKCVEAGLRYPVMNVLSAGGIKLACVLHLRTNVRSAFSNAKSFFFSC